MTRTIGTLVALSWLLGSGAAFAQQTPQMVTPQPAAPGGVQVVTPSAGAQTIAPIMPGPQPARGGAPAAGPTGFSVVLVLGDLKSNVIVEAAVPDSAKKALADMKDFLPYKTYQLLDSQWTRGTGPVLARLRGVDGKDYDVQIATDRQWSIVPITPGGAEGAPGGPAGFTGDRAFTYTASGVQSVRLVLSEAGGAAAGTTYEALKATAEQNVDVAKSRAEVAQLEKRVAELKANSLAANHPDVIAANRDLDLARMRLEVAMAAAASRSAGAAALVPSRGGRSGGAAQPRLIGSGRALIDTTFNMALGETVVVGTSRLQGDKALIVLLTAVK